MRRPNDLAPGMLSIKVEVLYTVLYKHFDVILSFLELLGTTRTNLKHLQMLHFSSRIQKASKKANMSTF